MHANFSYNYVEPQTQGPMRLFIAALVLSTAIPARAADPDELRPIRFATDSAALDTRALNDLEWNAHVLREHPEIDLVITGHTDATGHPDHNRELAADRAEAVRTALERADVDPERVTLIAAGEAYPRLPTGGETRANRRVEFLVDAPSDEVEDVESSIAPHRLPGLL